MLVIIRNKTDKNFLNTEIQFSFKDSDSRDRQILKLSLIPDENINCPGQGFPIPRRLIPQQHGAASPTGGAAAARPRRAN